ncbi:MAG: radical SAM protein [Anaerolineaceae bacterium]|nr:radical SAM protein [Anaerolineaceae bacterium]
MLPKDYVFVIQSSCGSPILYAPLHKQVVRIAPEATTCIDSILHGEMPKNKIQEKTYNTLYEHGFLSLPDNWNKTKGKEGHKIFLSITNKCNLRCIYCYANGGENQLSMQYEDAKKVLDSQIQEIIKSQDDKLAVTFHGGGEAFVEIGLLEKIVDYINFLAKEYNLKARINCVTNGTLLTNDVAKWVAENFYQITVSIDGWKEIQNLQRPVSSSLGSFDMLVSGIRNLLRYGVRFDFRATVTSFSVNKMGEFVSYVNENHLLNGGGVKFEPVSLSGRGRALADYSVNPEDFFLNYLKARDIGKRHGIKVSSSLDTFGETRDVYCGATNAKLQCYTPGGFLSSCTRVTKEVDMGADMFFYGRISEKQIIISEKLKKQIVDFTNSFEDTCYSCFARWNCQGGCSVTRLIDRENYENSCLLTKKILLHDIENMLTQNS